MWKANDATCGTDYSLKQILLSNHTLRCKQSIQPYPLHTTHTTQKEWMRFVFFPRDWRNKYKKDCQRHCKTHVTSQTFQKYNRWRIHLNSRRFWLSFPAVGKKARRRTTNSQWRRARELTLLHNAYLRHAWRCHLRQRLPNTSSIPVSRSL